MEFSGFFACRNAEAPKLINSQNLQGRTPRGQQSSCIMGRNAWNYRLSRQATVEKPWWRNLDSARIISCDQNTVIGGRLTNPISGSYKVLGFRDRAGFQATSTATTLSMNTAVSCEIKCRDHNSIWAVANRKNEFEKLVPKHFRERRRATKFSSADYGPWTSGRKCSSQPKGCELIRGPTKENHFALLSLFPLIFVIMGGFDYLVYP